MKTVLAAIGIVIFCLTSNHLNAQNRINLGQYMIHQPFINSASIGSYREMNGALVYRNQWAGFKGAPVTQGVNFNSPILDKNNFIGVSILHDKIGVNNTTSFGVQYAYKLRISRERSIAFGCEPKLVMQQSDYAQTHTIDENDPVYSANSPLFLMGNLGIGAYYFDQNFYAGFSIPKMFENELAYLDGDFSSNTDFRFKKLHYFFNAGYRLKLDRKNELNVSTLSKVVYGAPAQFDLNAQYWYNNQMGVGASFRTSKEVIAIFTIRFLNDFKLSYGYEINMNDIGKYSNGSHEIMLIYQRKRAQYSTLSVPRF